MKVCKFGGSSLADATQLNKVIDIVLADPARRIVVVSAPGKRDKGDTKVTDLLIALAKAALAGENIDRQLGAVVERYALIADELKLGEDIVSDITRDLRSRIAQAKDLRPEEFLDLVKAAGEDNNAKLVAVAFAARGRKARYASPKDTGMVLKGEFGDATLDPDSYATLSRAFSNFEGIVIYPGFFGYTKDGKVATFPRGGSDITGSILAAAICADVYENFTDVDAVYPVDPRLCPEATKGEGIREMTFAEMRELSYAGFAVFHDEAVMPAIRAKIPINIRNTNRPDEPGTMVLPRRRSVPGRVNGIASSAGFGALYVEKWLMNREVGFVAKLLSILAREKVSIECMPAGVDSVTVVFRDEQFPDDVRERVFAEVEAELKPDHMSYTREIGRAHV